MPCKTLYYILTLAQVIICGKDRLCLWGEGVDVCVWREGGGGLLGWGTARNSLKILQVTTIS